MARDNIIEEQILNLVQTHRIQEQSELQAFLTKRGYDIPQATLSRKLKKMKIAKVEGIYTLIELNKPHLPPILNIQVSESGIIVLHVPPGQANSLAIYLDRKYVANDQKNPKYSAILGSIAGDDTIILILRSAADAPSIIKMIQEDFGTK